MIHTELRITCDAYNKAEHYEGDDNETDMLIAARAKGWRRHKVSNGSMWDYCPRCESLQRQIVDQAPGVAQD